MASNVFPMLSSSPPPMDDCPEDEDDEDEFGNFTSALPYDSSFDSPVALNKIQQFKSCDKKDGPASSIVNNKNPNSKSPVPQETLSNCSTDNESQRNGFIPNKDSLFKSSAVSNSEVQESRWNCGFGDSSHISSHSVLKTIVNSEPSSLDSNKSEASLNSKNLDLDLRSDSSSSNCDNSGESFSKYDRRADVQEEPEVLSENERIIAQDSGKCLNNGTLSDSLSVEELSRQHLSSETCIERDPDIEELAGLKTGDDLSEHHDAKCQVDACSKCNKRESPELSKADSSVVNNSEPLNYDDECSNSETNHCRFVTDPDALHSERTDSKGFDDFSDCRFVDFQSCDAQPTPDLKDQHHSEQSSKTDKIQPAEVADSDLNFTVHPDDEFCDFTDSTSLNVLRESNVAPQDDSDDFADFQASSDFPQNNALAFADFPKASDPKTFDADFSDFQGGDFTEEDEFDDFQDFSKSVAPAEEEFADFSSVPFQSGNAAPVEEDGEFTDFAKAPPDSSSESSFEAFSSQKPLDPLSTLIKAVFPLPEEAAEESVPEYLPSPVLEQSNKSRRLWEKLHEVEQVPSLRFQWGVSHSFQQLLRSVNVDYHSILRTSSVPIFASGLSLLEPVKGQAASGSGEPAPLSTKDPIPPVHFDWNSSGLINPLDSGQVDSSLMDLSFLSSVKTNSSATNSDHSFENELLRPSPDLPSPDTFRKPPVLEQLLSKNISSLPNQGFPHRPSNLSEEATLTLDQLPDLSFMQAKVLMFPIISNDTC